MNNDWGSIDGSHCRTLGHNARYQTSRFKADCSFLLGDTLAPHCMAALCLVF